MALPTGKCSENGLAEEEDESDRLARASVLAFYEICPSSDVSIFETTSYRRSNCKRLMGDICN